MGVEFVSNVYLVDHHKVIQCNIRNITERKHLAEALQKAHKGLERRLETQDRCGPVLSLDAPSGF